MIAQLSQRWRAEIAAVAPKFAGTLGTSAVIAIVALTAMP